MAARHKLEWTSEFLKLQSKLEEHQVGNWVYSDTIKLGTGNKYTNLKLEFLYKINKDNEDFSEYKGETENKFVLIRTFLNYVSMAVADTEYELENNIKIIGAVNEDKEIEIQEIFHFLKWSKDKEFEYYEFQW